jgi:hypothetical protein
LRALVDRLNTLNWIVFVHQGHCPTPSTLGCLLGVVGTYDGAPCLRIMINTARPRHPDAYISTISHELQHALEVAEADDIHSALDLKNLFARIGHGGTRANGAAVFETAAAARVGTQVRRELRAHTSAWVETGMLFRSTRF